VPFAGAVFLKKIIRWDDATRLAIGVAEPLILSDRFGSRMNRREIWTCLAEVRDQTPTKQPSYRLARFGVPPVDKLLFVRSSLLVHVGVAAAESRRARICSHQSYFVAVVI
jgi:hypothetical protein